MAVARVHAHEACAQEVLLPEQGVARGHNGVDHAFVGEHVHLARCVERFCDFFVGCSGRLEHTVALGLADGMTDEVFDFHIAELGGVGGVGGVALTAFFAEEGSLQRTHVRLYGLFGILLHA